MNKNKWNLNGAWRCELPDGSSFEVQVPGCWDAGIRQKDIGSQVSYTKSFKLDKEAHLRYFLRFGGVSYYCEIRVNGVRVGTHEGMWDNFSLDVTNFLQKGENTIELFIIKPGYKSDDPFPLRQVLSGFIPDVLCTFGGIWDDVWLEACEQYLVNSHYGSGNTKGETEIHVSGTFFEEGEAFVSADLFAPSGEKVLSLSQKVMTVNKGENSFTLSLKLDEVCLWDMQTPLMYKYEVHLSYKGQDETLSKSFGFRDIAYKGTQLLLNNRPIYARGILHWGYYDEEIIPNPSRETIVKEIAQCKDHGFNMIKHCLYIPREAYFELADQMGMLLWIELPLWLPEATPALPERIRREYPRILEQIAGHPSVIMLSLGCELDSGVDSGILEEMYHLARSKSDALIRDNSGSGECYDGLAVDFADFFDYHFYSDLQNMENLMEVFTPSWRNYRPWFFGEFCDSDTLRDLNDVRKGKGTDKLFWEESDHASNPISLLKPDFFLDKHDERMEKSGIRKDLKLLKALSVNHSMVHRKVALEYTRSFSEISGYNITSIRDVPIATSGIFDDMMAPKFPRETFVQTNSDLVLTPAWDLTRAWINGDRVRNKERYNFISGSYYSLHILLSNYGREKLVSPRLDWELLRGEEAILKGSEVLSGVFDVGTVRELGYIHFTLPEVKSPETLVLSVRMTCGELNAINSWPVFVYNKPAFPDKRMGLYDPANVFTGIDRLFTVKRFMDDEEIGDTDIMLTSRLTPQILSYARNGGRVFFIQRYEGLIPIKKVAFWREGMIRCLSHPSLNGLAYEKWFDDLRFFSVSTDTAFDTEKLIGQHFDEICPIIRRYDCREWQAADYMLELKTGEGAIVATTLRFEGNMGKQPLGIGGNVFAQWLLSSAIEYLLKDE